MQLTEAELESVETESSNNIELKEFIPLSKIDLVYFESAYYLGAGEGGEKPYRLLADAMSNSDRAAIAHPGRARSVRSHEISRATASTRTAMV